MTVFWAEYGADYEPQPDCRGKGVILYPDGAEKCPGCDNCDPEVVDDALRRIRERNDAIYTQAIRGWFNKTEAA